MVGYYMELIKPTWYTLCSNYRTMDAPFLKYSNCTSLYSNRITMMLSGCYYKPINYTS